MERLAKLKQTFKAFERSHEVYHESLTEQDSIEESDQYFFDVQDKYIEVVRSTKTWLKEESEVKQEVNGSGSEHSDDIDRGELLSLMTLPKIEIEQYDGDPMKFHSFIALFEESVEKVVKEGTTKLTRLLQYTTGKAKDAIRSCALVGGEKGYTQARDILFKRFGNNH